jgi:ankyrin repeat protein
VDAASRNDFRVAPLHSAVAGRGHAAIARRLVEVGADVNVRQRHGWTPLHGAVHMGDADLVRFLLSHGADPKAATDDGETAIDMARKAGDQQMVELLSGARASG